MVVDPMVTAIQGRALSILNLNVPCQTINVEAPLVTNHSCVDGICVPDVNGIFPTLQDCIDSGCAAPSPPSGGGGGGAIIFVGLALLGLTMSSKKK
jgi:hypothetical protein